MSHINVTINGRQYRMACEEGQEVRLLKLAESLESRVEGLRGKFGEIGDARLTVMAALTVCDDLLDAGQRIRALEEELRMRSTTGKLKFGVIADADRMMPQSANAFLKTLEEPPNGSLLLLLTSLPEALLETIRSRCVILTLRSPSRRPLGLSERVFFDAVSEMTNERSWTVGSGLALARLFQDQLARIRDDIETEHDERLKHESGLYKNSTDGKWLEQEEDRLDVLTESRYIRARMAFVEKILEWYGDALRARQGGEQRDLDDYREATASFAKGIPVRNLLERVRAFQELRVHVSPNVHEGLAIEVAFLKGFGPLPGDRLSPQSPR